jgi:hypothetical protein
MHMTRGEATQLFPHFLELRRMDLLEGIHPKGDTHSRAVGQECSKSCLLKEAKYQDLVPKIQGGNELKRGK